MTVYGLHREARIEIYASPEAVDDLVPTMRFPMDARHPVAQQPYGAYAVGEVFPLTYQGQLYDGRVIERLVSRADGLVELHVQAALGEAHALEGAPQ